MDLGGDPKLMLQQMCQRLCKRPVDKADIIYNPARVQSGGTQATVKLNCLQGQEFAGEVCASARDAEKSAAQQALQFFANTMDMSALAGMPMGQPRPPRPRMPNTLEAQHMLAMAQAQAAPSPFGQPPLGQVAMGQGVFGQGLPQGFGQGAVLQGAPGAFGMPVNLPQTPMDTRSVEAAMGGPRGPPSGKGGGGPRGPRPGGPPGGKGPSNRPMGPGGARPPSGVPKAPGGGRGSGQKSAGGGGGKPGGPGRGPKAPSAGKGPPAARGPSPPLVGAPASLLAAAPPGGASPDGAEAGNMNMETSKSSLNVACMKILKRPMQKGEIVYDSPQVMGGFKSTVRLPCLPGAWSEKTWMSEVCTSRKAAEQDAAGVALAALAADPELGAAMSEVNKPVKKAGSPAEGEGKPAKGKGKGKGKRDFAIWAGLWWGPRSGPDLPREQIGEGPVMGSVTEWKGSFGWIKPTGEVDHPMASRREGKVYVHKKDLAGELSELETGATVSFSLYADSSGLGAQEVSLA